MKALAKIVVILISLVPCLAFASCPHPHLLKYTYSNFNPKGYYYFGFIDNRTFQTAAPISFNPPPITLELKSALAEVTPEGYALKLRCIYSSVEESASAPLATQVVLDLYKKDFYILQMQLNSNGWHLNQPPNQYSCEVSPGSNYPYVTQPRTCAFLTKQFYIDWDGRMTDKLP